MVIACRIRLSPAFQRANLRSSADKNKHSQQSQIFGASENPVETMNAVPPDQFLSSSPDEGASSRLSSRRSQTPENLAGNEGLKRTLGCELDVVA
jgi:hypothetical protein